MTASRAPRRLVRTACRRGAIGAVLAMSIVLGGCVAPAPRIESGTDATLEDDSRLVVVAVDDSPPLVTTAGATPRASYRMAPSYEGSPDARSVATALARDMALQERAAWTIAPLRVRCMLYRIAPGADREAVLARLARDPRVRIAQAQQAFETLAAPYDDPYVGLQRGFAAIDAAAAQAWSSGEGVRIAVVDSGIDRQHPDLAGQSIVVRDFVGPRHPSMPTGEPHGTGIAGVIAARPNNGLGIVGIAPGATLLAFRGCWPTAEPQGGSRCDSFTLARALGAAIEAGADVINLSLGGPSDPLLEALARHAMANGAVIVGALPADGRRGGFPTGIDGVLAVAPLEGRPVMPGVLRAPGLEILTLAPGGHYDYASGSSFSAAHVTGAVALLRALDRATPAATLERWLAADADGVDPPPSVRAPTGFRTEAPARAIDLCGALRHLRPQAACNGRAEHAAR